ncbi:uncharacterized protein TEOVI_000351800 [Trypanosoma equiperdum]|uniref:Roadblock/LC7 domain containing protein n=1 Tax=Trypanosoma equiperdum TaxID=5694 RepID=A0A1G4IHL4_TRYEQ|nr:hypothetical protein, conserved [Trypanosoma equiperdum]
MSTMDVPGTAIEQYFNQLIQMRLLTQVIVSDTRGDTTVACLMGLEHGGDAVVSSSEDTYGVAESVMESNVALSGARCFQNLDQLNLGVPLYVSFQYHDDVVVQTLDGCCMLTLIGSRSQGHFVGGLLTLLDQIRSCEAYQELLTQTQLCFR